MNLLRSLLFAAVWSLYGLSASATVDMTVSPCPSEFENSPSYLRDQTSDAISILYPRRRSVYQRGADNQANVGFIGQRTKAGKALLLRVRNRSNGAIVRTHCEPLSSSSPTGDYAILMKIPAGGWYFLEVALIKTDNSIERATLDSFGVGEIFVAAGQSNAANGGEPTGLGPFENVSSFNPWTQSWEAAKDPMPVAMGSWGSPWPLMGALLADRLQVPIGIVSLACSGTSVEQWRPDAANTWFCNGPQSGNLYSRLKETALRLKGYGGFRSILWVQGEADAFYATTDRIRYNPQTYIQNLYDIMYQLNADTQPNTASGIWAWGVAKASFVPTTFRTKPDDPPCGTAKLAGSDIIAPAFNEIWSKGLAFQGPTTDDWIGPEYRWDDPKISSCAHFTKLGLSLHARGWYDAVMKRFFREEFHEK